MRYYLYFPVTGIYNGAVDLTGNRKDPENATTTEPPEAEEGQVAVFLDGEWELMEDHLGMYWNTETKEKVSHITPGPLPENLTALEPPSADHQWTGEAWELPLAVAKALKLAEIAAARYAAEIAGITVPGIDGIKTDRESQAMITGAALKAMQDPEYTCNWKTAGGFVPVNAAAILAVADLVRQHVQTCFDREAELVDQVKDAETVEEVQTIQWQLD